MSTALILMVRWRKWQRELRCRKGLGLFDSVRFGLWLARGSAARAPKLESQDGTYGAAQAA